MAKQFLFTCDNTEVPQLPSSDEKRRAFHNRGNLFTRTNDKLTELCKKLQKNFHASNENNDEIITFVPRPPSKPSFRNASCQRLQSAKGRLEHQTSSNEDQQFSVVNVGQQMITGPRSFSARPNRESSSDNMSPLDQFKLEQMKKIQYLRRELEKEKERQEMMQREKNWQVTGLAKARTFDDYMTSKPTSKAKGPSVKTPQNIVACIDLDIGTGSSTDEDAENALSSPKQIPVKKQSLPLTLEPLRPWLTMGVPQAVTGIDPEDCLVFLPSLLRVEDWMDLPELPEETSAEDYLPCSEVIVPSPPVKKYEHPFNHRKLPELKWSCHHTTGTGEKEADENSKVPSVPKVPSSNIQAVREEVRELELLLQGVGSHSSGCIVCRYQAEISHLKKMSERILAKVPKFSRHHPDPDSEPAEDDTFGLVKVCVEHKEVMQQLQQQHQRCVLELAHLESDLDLADHQREFSHKPVEIESFSASGEQRGDIQDEPKGKTDALSGREKQARYNQDLSGSEDESLISEDELWGLTQVQSYVATKSLSDKDKQFEAEDHSKDQVPLPYQEDGHKTGGWQGLTTSMQKKEVQLQLACDGWDIFASDNLPEPCLEEKGRTDDQCSPSKDMLRKRSVSCEQFTFHSNQKAPEKKTTLGSVHKATEKNPQGSAQRATQLAEFFKESRRTPSRQTPISEGCSESKRTPSRQTPISERCSESKRTPSRQTPISERCSESKRTPSRQTPVPEGCSESKPGRHAWQPHSEKGLLHEKITRKEWLKQIDTLTQDDIPEGVDYDSCQRRSSLRDVSGIPEQSSWCYCNGLPGALLHTSSCPYVSKLHFPH